MLVRVYATPICQGLTGGATTMLQKPAVDISAAAATGGVVLEDAVPNPGPGPQKRHRRRDEKKQSNSQRKRSQRMAQARVKKRTRSELMSEVAKGNLDAEETKLLKSSALLGRGATEGTLKEKLTRELKLQRAGLNVNGTRDSRLLVERSAREADEFPRVYPSQVRVDVEANVGGSAESPTMSDEEYAKEDRAETHHVPQKFVVESEVTGIESQPLDRTSKLGSPDEDSRTIKRISRSRRPRVAKSSREFASSVFTGSKSQTRTAKEVLQAKILEMLDDGFAAGSDGHSDSTRGSQSSEASSDDEEADIGEIERSGDEGADSPGENESNQPKNFHDEQKSRSTGTVLETAPLRDGIPLGSKYRQEPAEPPEMDIITKPKFVVHVNRDPSLAEARMALPVCAKEQEIMEAIEESDIVFISGATGSGKTTQVPQFLYEAGFGNSGSPLYPGRIAVVQPRRVAVMSCARRVATELNKTLGREVGYQIRHKNRTTEETGLTFLTDGILVKEIEEDFLMRRYSAIIIDEAHERALNTDLLLVLLAKSTQTRRNRQHLAPLKVIIMSATLDLDDFFDGAHSFLKRSTTPVIEVESRQYPVTIHFSRKTPEDYVEECVKKVCKLHRKLPAGDVLVFVTGRLEVLKICRELNEAFPDRKSFVALPLYSMLSEKEQRKAFGPATPSRRKVVVSTNVAETSLTIPGICYVIDSGKAKEKVYRGDLNRNVSTFAINWISKASAAQRSGRAGRVGPGHCYRLYSSAVFQNDFAEYREPEALRIPVDALTLKLRGMGISNVGEFPLPSRPPHDSLVEADKTLRFIGALDVTSGGLRLSVVGHQLAQLPLSPRLGRFLLSAHGLGCFRYATRMAAAMSVGDLFLREKAKPAPRSRDCSVFAHPLSESLTCLRAVAAAEHAHLAENKLQEFCDEYSLHFRNIKETLDISRQLERLFEVEKLNVAVEPPTEKVEVDLRKCLLLGYPDHVGRRLPREEARQAGIKGRRSLQTFRAPQLMSENIFLPGDSSIPIEVEFVCFSELTKDESTERVTMRHVTAISQDWIAASCEALCAFDEPAPDQRPTYNRQLDRVTCWRPARYGPQAWSLGLVESCLPEKMAHQLELLQFQVFGQSFLNGEVVESLGWLSGCLTIRPSDCLLLSSKAKVFVAALKNRGCASREALLRVFDTNGSFLLAEVSNITKPGARAQLRATWPPS